MQNEKNIRDALCAVLEKLIEVAPTAEQEWPELVRRAKDALASDDIDPAWADVCAACAKGMPPKWCAYYGDPNGCNAPTLGRHPEGDLAERLQEALEKSERRIAELERAPGNAAAMREALGEILDKIDAWRTDGSMEHCQYSHLFDICDAALAAPARNCDVGTAQEQAERFKTFCLPRVLKCSENSKCPAKHPCNQIGIQYCQLKWAQMPFAPAEGGAE